MLCLCSCLDTFGLAFLLGVFALADEPISFLSMIGLVAVVLMMTLSGLMWQYGGDTKRALHLWVIVAGGDVLCILILAGIFKFIT